MPMNVYKNSLINNFWAFNSHALLQHCVPVLNEIGKIHGLHRRQRHMHTDKIMSE